MSKPIISVIIPAFNEEKNIIETVNSLRLLHYPQFEIVVVDDGSTDDTLAQLVKTFKLKRVNKVARQQLEAQPVKAVYESQEFANLVVISKMNGGKSDALNCGINYTHYPYFCTIDADTVLRHERAGLPGDDSATAAGRGQMARQLPKESPARTPGHFGS